MFYTILLLTRPVVSFSLFAWFYHKTIKLHAELGFLSNNYLETNQQNQILQQEKISYIQKIEQLTRFLCLKNLVKTEVL
ncbi:MULTISPECIES: hypothetical protein [unclassified Candidatus Tisiphia]